MSTIAEDRSPGQMLCTSSGTPQGHLAAEHHHLMTQHHDLRVFGRLAPAQQDQPAEHPDHEQVQQTDRHESRSCLNPPIPQNRRSRAIYRVLKRYRRIEEDIRAAKSLTGLDHGQVTCWNSWMRWSLISLIAAALLAVALARTRSASPPSATGLIPLTRPELLALLQAAVLGAPRRDLAHILHWSRWRRRHQHRAATCHRRWNEITAAAAI